MVSNAFVHFQPLHLIFNLYWLWILGGAFERTFGPVRFLLFMLVAAYISSGIAQFEGHGIGMSGVGYALFGFGWVGRRRYPEFARVVNDRTIQMFVLWGLFCVVATYAHIMNIGNLAHLSGGLFGAVAAGLLVLPELRLWLTAALILLASGSVLSAKWNPRSIEWVAIQAEKAEQRGDFRQAAELYRRTLDLDANPNWAWPHIAICYAELGSKAEYEIALAEVKSIDPEMARELIEDYGDPAKPPEVGKTGGPGVK